MLIGDGVGPFLLLLLLFLIYFNILLVIALRKTDERC